MPVVQLVLLALVTLAATFWLTGRVLGYLRRRQIMDLPNSRSSHSLPVPRGGGLAVTPVLALALLVPSWRLDSVPAALLAVGALILLAISWIDDRRGLPPLPRFLAHGLVIAMVLAAIPSGPILPLAVPVWADRVMVGIGWLWFVNLYNFMDGIDGITGVESTSLGLGIAMVATLTGGNDLLAAGGLAVAGVGLGFLLWNWHPAKLFLGDSGSVPLGYVLGGLLVLLALHGQVAAAFILPAYYLADATITLTRRALRGEKIWQAHRQHFYQRAVRGGKRHDQVARIIALGNLALLAAAVLAALGWVWPGLGLAVLITGAVLRLLSRWGKDCPP